MLSPAQGPRAACLRAQLGPSTPTLHHWTSSLQRLKPDWKFEGPVTQLLQRTQKSRGENKIRYSCGENTLLLGTRRAMLSY